VAELGWPTEYDVQQSVRKAKRSQIATLLEASRVECLIGTISNLIMRQIAQVKLHCIASSLGIQDISIEPIKLWHLVRHRTIQPAVRNHLCHLPRLAL